MHHDAQPIASHSHLKCCHQNVTKLPACRLCRSADIHMHESHAVLSSSLLPQNYCILTSNAQIHYRSIVYTKFFQTALCTRGYSFHFCYFGDLFLTKFAICILKRGLVVNLLQTSTYKRPIKPPVCVRTGCCNCKSMSNFE